MKPEAIIRIKVKKGGLPVDRPTKEDKDREKGMMEALENEDFYGKKKSKEKQKSMDEKAMKDAKSDAAVKKMNVLIAAKLRAKK